MPPAAEDLVDGGAFFQRALGHYFSPHLLHVEHERVQRLLYVRFLVLVFLIGAWRLRVNWRTELSVGFLFDDWRDYGRMRDARLMKTMRMMRDEVRRKATGHQTGHGCVHG